VKRGDLIRVSLAGGYGKPRPAVVIQADTYADIPSVAILPLTSDLRPVPVVRVTVKPDRSNGLKVISQVMIDKPHTIAREKAGNVFGTLSADDLMQVDQLLSSFLGLSGVKLDVNDRSKT
jgi:mRNA interferase MazF